MKILQQKVRLQGLILSLLMLPIFGFGQYYNDVLSYRYNGTPTNGIKISTNIPFINHTQMPTIMIEGYDYGTSTPIDLKLVYYVYNDNFVRYKIAGTTNYQPDVYLTKENGKVVIFIDKKTYYNRFHIRAYAHMSEQAAWFTGWTASDSPKPTAAEEVLVPYENQTVSGSQINFPLSGTENGVTEILAPEGGSMIANGIVTGAIKIKLPVLYTNTMVRFRVEVFNYIADKSFTAIIGGYNYAPSTIWHNCSAQIITTSLDNNHKVYFGDDGANTVIWIGETTTEWKYLKVRVTEVQAGHQNNTAATWGAGWNVSLDASSFGSMVNRTVTNVLPVSSSSSVWVKTGDDVSYTNTDGKVGIGTSNLTAELTVNGHIHAKEVRVYTDAGADFVFEPDYKLLSLEELESFVKENRHLPNIAPEKDMVKSGLELAEMNIKLLQKVEELTLYLIELNKKIEALESH